MKKLYNFNSRTSCEVRPAGADGASAGPYDFNSRTSCEVRQCVLRPP